MTNYLSHYIQLIKKFITRVDESHVKDQFLLKIITFIKRYFSYSKPCWHPQPMKEQLFFLFNYFHLFIECEK